MTHSNDKIDYVMIHLLQDESLRKYNESSSSSSDNEEEITRLHRVHDFYETVVQAYSDKEFKSNFRLERSSFNSLMTFLEPLMTPINMLHTGGREMIPNKKKVLITLYYLANQDSFRQVSNLFNISKSTAHAIINYVVDLIYKHSPKFIKWPTREEAMANEKRFFDKGGLKNVLGCIDGSHIPILNLGGDTDYINRKGFSSILLQGVVNYKMEFIDVDCGEPGSMHDSRMLKKSGLYRILQEDPAKIYGYFLLGDSAYMTQDWLVPPFKDTGNLTAQERRFNKVHSSLRVRVENAFGMLKGRFRRLREFQNVNRIFIIKATICAIVFHNICIAQNDEIDVISDTRSQPQNFEPEDISIDRHNNRRQQAFMQLFEN